MAKINFKNGAINETYNLETVKPTPPFATIKQGNLDYFLKLTDKACGNNKIKINGMFVYVQSIGEDKFLYYSDKNNILHKVNANNGREIWNYESQRPIKNIAFNSSSNKIYIQDEEAIVIINNKNGHMWCTSFSQTNNRICIDNNILYGTKGNQVKKFTIKDDNNFAEISNYSVNGDITNLCSDDKGNIYIGTSSEITKVKNDFVASGESRNLLPPFDNSARNWTTSSTNNINSAYIDKKTIFINKNYKYDFIFTLNHFILAKPNTKYTLSWKYMKGSEIGTCVILYKSGNFVKNLGDTVITGNSYTFTTTDCNNISLYFNKIDTDYEITDVQLEEGDKATPYSPKGEYVQNYEWRYNISNLTSLATKGDNLYIATKDDIQVLDSNGNMIDGLNYTNTNAIAVAKNGMYLGQGNDLSEYVNNNKQWTSKNNSEITNIILE